MKSTEKKYFVTSDLFSEHEASEVVIADHRVRVGSDEFELRISDTPGVFIIVKDGREIPVKASFDGKGNVSISYNGYNYDLCVSSEKESAYSKMLRASSEVKPGPAKIISPMPGLIKGISVTNGQSVKKGENLFILEAMKMENIIKAPIAATVQNLGIKEGNTVEKGTVLCVLEPQ